MTYKWNIFCFELPEKSKEVCSGSLTKARDTQLKNIENKTGKGIDELRSIINQSGLNKHGEIRSMLTEKFGLGYGDANSLVHFALETDGQTAAEASNTSIEDLVSEIYSGPKANFRVLHDHLNAYYSRFWGV